MTEQNEGFNLEIEVVTHLCMDGVCERRSMCIIDIM